jgi:hypothetical protein
MPRPSYSEQEGTTKRTPRKKKRFSIATRDEQTKRNETKRKSKNWDKETGRRTKEARENPNGKTGKKNRGIVYRKPDGTAGVDETAASSNHTENKPNDRTQRTNPHEPGIHHLPNQNENEGTQKKPSISPPETKNRRPKTASAPTSPPQISR